MIGLCFETKYNTKIKVISEAGFEDYNCLSINFNGDVLDIKYPVLVNKYYFLECKEMSSEIFDYIYAHTIMFLNMKQGIK